MTEFNWSQFTTRIPVAADKASLYDAWATRVEGGLDLRNKDVSIKNLVNS